MQLETENETLALLRDSAAGFARFDGRRIRGCRGRSPGYDREVWRQMGGLGWFSLAVPEADGGLGLGIEAAAALAEQLGIACFPEPYVAAGFLVPVLLAQATNQRLKRDLLPGVLTGDLVVSLAWQSESGGLEPEMTGVTAACRSGSVTLSGQSRFILPAAADAYLVLARSGSDFLLVCVRAEEARPGLLEETGPDGVPNGWLRFNGLSIPEAEVLLIGPGVANIVRSAIDLAIIAQSAELCGLMQRSFDLTLEYLRTRKQFGAAIGSFQALQHRAVDLYIQQELARHATNAAVRMAAGGALGNSLALAASSAKARAAHAGLLIGTQAIQLHGAIGFTDEYDLGLYVNRIVRLTASLGNAADHRRRFGALSEGA